MLAAFVAQAGYLSSRTPLSALELQFVQTGVAHSPLVTHIVRVLTHFGSPEWMLRMPFILTGALLGASVWYVARRLYGNAGGYTALALFTFSPATITSTAHIAPEIIAAWGTFGCIFTGIGVAHTLYAPREVVLWNWKRILLLAVAIAVGVSAQFAVVLAIPIALGFMFYLVPERRKAALAIIGASSALGYLLVVLAYGLHFDVLARAARPMAAVTLHIAGTRLAWYMVAVFLFRNGPGFLLLLLLSCVTYAVWRRTRFFGNTAPLLTALVLVVAALVMPYAAGFPFLLLALPFVFVFMAGIMADLLQSRQSPLFLGLVLAGLTVHAGFSLLGLWRL
jgi:hypothetical protein